MIKNTSRHVSHEYEILCTHTTRHKKQQQSNLKMVCLCQNNLVIKWWQIFSIDIQVQQVT